MKRLILLVVVGAAAAIAGWYIWNLSQRTSSAYVSVLLPRETIFLAHMPDFNRTRDQWRQSDIYALYREPEVQDFLRKPLAGLSETPKAFGAQTLLEFEQLEPKNVFFALTSLDDNSPKLAGGFRFRGSIADAERVIGKWRSKFLERNPGARREKLHYEHHEIELVAVAPFTLATAYDRPWFFAANDLKQLKALLNLGERMETLNQAAGFSGMTQKLAQAFSDSGVTADDWKAAFGLELGSLADWPSSAHWPTLLLTLPVLDVAKAGKIVEAATRADEDAIWTRAEKDGVRYFSMQSPGALVALTPTIALSDRLLVAGFNPVSVEEAVKRSGNASSELADSQTYKSAARLVPAPTNFFAYIDTQLLYSRLDASLRPMLLLAAAFMPALSSSVDLGKIPSPEVITKHLSPIVSSQRYERDGYVAESVGPITFNQSVIGLAILSGAGAAARQKASRSLSGLGSPPPGSPQPSPSPSPTSRNPAPTP